MYWLHGENCAESFGILGSGNPPERGKRALRFVELARVLVRFNHVARFIVNANHSIM
jgi:hypothetical protein